MIDVKKMLTLLVCCGTCLTAATSRADFVGVVSEFKIDAETADLCGAANGADVPFPLTVCNVSIQFDEDDDRLLSVGFADLQVMNGGVPGVFYHHTFGQDRPYSCGDLRPFPDLICDSYVAIGEKCEGIGGTGLDADFDSHGGFNKSGHINGGWFNFDPFNGLGDAANHPDGKILILQSSVAQGLSLEGSVIVFWHNIGVHEVLEAAVEIVCEAQCPIACPTDSNGDGDIGPFDLATLLGAWGPCAPGDPCECLDANGDGAIGSFDLAILLAAWGPCP